MAGTWRRRRQKSNEATGGGPGPQAPPGGAAAPERPSQLRPRSWFAVLRRTVTEFRGDELPDRAAALTYYGVLAIFPALLVLVSTLGFVSQSAADTILTNVQQLAPGSARDIVRDSVTGIRASPGTGSVLAAVGLVGALWSASSYIAAFIRAANVVYDIPEGRPVWKVVPLRLAVTILMVILLAASTGIVVLSGGVADRVGRILDVDVTSLHAWSYAKWPALAILVSMMISLLYWSAPNVRVRGFRWLTPGTILAVALWLGASAGFAVYVANFGSYNKTYGTLAGVIVFLIWLWLSNLSILLGLEFDAEIARERALLGGLAAHTEPCTQPRDTRTWRRRRGPGDSRPTEPALSREPS
ncbi:YihY/virulence factor BrkB family protein [Frankia sp. AgB32]|uniref:YihY/virulence factor BrkB family protein n=1 Tax=Frankia sp. AgB32 TaxID=631119 RepID=UPI00200F18A0|nr:YihY/virulence factor BrkB family protein [Frankia sp. AgB32]MCK9896176.1 YihY/virulence factor BrkB family protein [Frankia sp. AgB32]